MFQFLRGTLKTVRTAPAASVTLVGFNSLEVRLKHSVGNFRIYVAWRLFQFLRGTLKTSPGFLFALNLFKFQFLRGTLKTVPAFGTSCGLVSFNSLEVRLKPDRSVRKRRGYPRLFQFLRGTLKTFRHGRLPY